MAAVYRARDVRLGREVAVKVLHPHFSVDPEIVQRFEREAQFAASLSAHPNIVSVFDVGQDGDLHYMIMELVDGFSLKAAIKEEAPFNVDRACHIAAEVASALDFAHRHGFVHRDIKPQNILISRDGTVKVTDFGIAFSAGSTQVTRTGTMFGTAQYISPEQVQGKTATSVSDVYSLGVVLFEMLTGELPFEADSTIALAMKHIKEPVRTPSSYRPGIPAEVDAIVLRALSKEPDRRFANAAAFREALRGRALRQPSRERRFEAKPTTSHHSVIAGLMLVVLVGVCGLGAFATYLKLSPHTAAPTGPSRTPNKAPSVPSHHKHHSGPPATPVSKPTSPPPVIARGMRLTYIFVSPAYVQPGGMVSLTYTVVNGSGGSVPVELGATIIHRGNRLAFTDHTHATTVTSRPGTGRYTRSFEVPATAPAGPYNLLVSANTPNLGHNYGQLLIPGLVKVGGSSTG
jgi:serine/threonine protein kinase